MHCQNNYLCLLVGHYNIVKVAITYQTSGCVFTEEMMQHAEQQQAENEQFRNGGKISRKSKRISEEVLTTRGTLREFCTLHISSSQSFWGDDLFDREEKKALWSLFVTALKSGKKGCFQLFRNTLDKKKNTFNK